jgi:hypothetical protein
MIARVTTAPESPWHGRDAQLGLRPGDLVEVKSEAEILRTLDERGRLDGVPFMPEMLKWCGQRGRVAARADKTCDTVTKTGGRRMTHAVHLEGLRCDGGAHGGCQAGCLLFWKESWLRRTDQPDRRRDEAGPVGAGDRGCDKGTLFTATCAPSSSELGGDRFVCQATELARATTPLAWWDVRQYVRDVRSGNVRIRELLKGIASRTVLNAFENLQRLPGGFRLAAVLVRLTDKIWPIPRLDGRLTKTPRETLGLRPGDRIRVKSKEEICATLDRANRNRGLTFDVEMLAYAGRECTVLRRVEQIIDERTGRMMRLPNDCIVLDGVVCPGRLSERRLFCPRAIYPFWREIWLQRID